MLLGRAEDAEALARLVGHLLAVLRADATVLGVVVLLALHTLDVVGERGRQVALSCFAGRSNTWFETIAGNQRTCSHASAMSSDTCAGAHAMTLISDGSRPASSAAART